MKTLIDVCIEAILADDFWRVQRKQLMRLPEHLANRLLESLLEQDRITSAQVEMFAPCATSISLAPSNHVGDGGAWLPAISRFRTSGLSPARASPPELFSIYPL
ncbi:hypothetical protein COCOBI_04-3170 [Coccomyxa sp. Obi]|nr:hypothetical protein COCOBI_04-3170 [Coccomyxa sp. Obi]